MCWRVYCIYWIYLFFPSPSRPHSMLFSSSLSFQYRARAIYPWNIQNFISEKNITALPPPNSSNHTLFHSHHALTPSFSSPKSEHQLLRNDASAHFSMVFFLFFFSSWENKILIPKVLKQETFTIYVIRFYSLRVLKLLWLLNQKFMMIIKFLKHHMWHHLHTYTLIKLLIKILANIVIKFNDSKCNWFALIANVIKIAQGTAFNLTANMELAEW